MAEEYDIKVVWRCIIHVILVICQDKDNNNSKEMDVVNQKEREGDTRTTSVVEKGDHTKPTVLSQFQSVYICYKK